MALALEHLPSMAWKKQHWPEMDTSTHCTWIVPIQVLPLARAVTLSLSSFMEALPRWQTQWAHLLLCTCWFKVFTSTGVWPWLRQWLPSFTFFLKHSSWETAAWAEHADPLLSLLSKSSPTVLRGNGGYLLRHTSQEMMYCRPQCNPEGAKTCQENSAHVLVVSILGCQLSLFCYWNRKTMN